MQETSKTTIRDMLMRMPMDELDALFQAELEKEVPDAAMIRLFMDIFREKDTISQDMITPGIERAWERYCDESLKLEKKVNERRRMRSWVIRAAAAVALVCLVFSVIPQSASADGFWGKFTRWTSDFLEFFSGGDNDGRMEAYIFESENADLVNVYETVTEQGISVPLVPMWIPEGYKLSECKVISLPAKTSVVSAFVNGESTITMNFAIYHSEVSQKYQKDEAEVQHYEVHNTDHIIMRNNDMWSVLWKQENIEASIFINCQEDTLYKIIESIYVMEDE